MSATPQIPPEAAALGVRGPLIPLHGGCIGEVYRAQWEDGTGVVLKVGAASGGALHVEGRMLDYLARQSSLPVPRVLHASASLLVMTHLPGQSRFTRESEEHAAELLAALHRISAPQFGFEFDTLIGGLHQPNPWTATWVEFFAQQRLLHRALAAERIGRLPASLRKRIETLAGKLDTLLIEPRHPSLLHGDVWTTNVMAEGGCITGFLDPAIYYGHPEIELAFITLFGTFGQGFFQRYAELGNRSRLF